MRVLPRKRMRCILLLTSSLLLAALGRGALADPAQATEREPGAAFEARRVRILRTDSAPVIDADLGDPVWEGASVLQPLIQVFPTEGAEPSERTEIRLLYDSDFLYIYVRAWDREPEAIAASVMVEDTEMTSDDRINLVFDTFDSRREALFFQINPVGTRSDAFLEGSRRFIRDWDGIWYGKARIDAEGWRAEMAIPFKTLNFDPASPRWGFNVERIIRRRNEVVRWASISQDVSITNLSYIGTLEGLRGLDQGLGLDVKPFFAGIYDRDRIREDTDRIGRPGLDLFYKFTPSLTGALTLNTDFSEAPVDDRQVNLTRFALFFPETRDFFLQDVGIFEFGGLVEENGLPYFSRRIGIGEGEVVNLRGGGKLTGRIGRVNVGLLDVQTEAYSYRDADTGEFIDVSTKNLLVGRVSVNLLEESSAGVILTNGDPASDDRNTLVGADFRYRNSRIRGDKTLVGDLFFTRSFSERHDSREAAFGAKLEYPNDIVNWKLEFTEIQENFEPGLGFVNRWGVRQYEADFRYRLRLNGRLRTADSKLSGLVVTNRDHNLETGELTWTLFDLENHYRDSFEGKYVFTTERLDAPFLLPDGVVIPPGDYTFHRGGLKLETSNARPVRGIFELEWGEYFDGRRIDAIGTLELRPSPHLFVGLEFTQNAIRLPQGDATVRLGRLRLDVNVNPDLSWTNLVQYDNVTDTVGLNSRLRWIIRPGDELFLVFDQGWRVDDRRLEPTFSQATLKVVYTFRF